ncbi:putative alpha-E superfamily protein [Rhodoblastus acidophilus]|uniref:alpha-E domain-containing protein n=1 Tax=Rhodoblastus acidophilus TaxID=1074 RepID=UPI001619FEFA|nr:alpha-E domain-containing protein [Rhodoblastus acidophilus]MCW2285484.1 putative alpha-E superfamily protein [Rhodoblastus acidophilus]MCW2334432.1 putative alpha-E superfamily protein [Rhodoblastus acidophilus]
MLARTADNIYWVSRYLERADFLARLIEASNRISALPTTYAAKQDEWTSVLIASGADETFPKHFDVANEANVIAYLAFDPRNLSSIRSCIEFARTNARAVRTALTVEMWEHINSAWIKLKAFEQRHSDPTAIDREALIGFLDFVKETSSLYDGFGYRTMLRNDIYYFARLGVSLERADNTARVLDVKYQLLLPEHEPLGGSVDYFQWSAILRSVSALTAYHWVYRESIKPWNVADLLILRQEMPRSLIHCTSEVVRWLDAIGNQYGRHGNAQRQARAIQRKLENASIKEIFQSGLHEFVDGFITENNGLANAIAEQYLLG